MTITAPARRPGLACPRPPPLAELATIAAGYLGHALVRLAIEANRHAVEGSVICAQMTYSALTNRGIPAISNERVFGRV